MVALIIILTGFIYLIKTSEALAIPLFLVFLILKLTNVLAWSWVCVCIPLMVFPILFILQFCIIALMTYCAENV